MGGQRVSATDGTYQARLRGACLAEGRAFRRRAPRSEHAQWRADMRTRDPVDMLVITARTRLQDLLPLRYGRMSRSPFAYMRGSAAMMASDVGGGPLTQLIVQACGDCHLGNFGVFASPERRLLFDINDFDETLPASWEFDLKRLVTSFVLLGREQGIDRVAQRQAAIAVGESYAARLREYALASPLDAWYSIIDFDALIRAAPDEATRQRRIALERKARQRTGGSMARKLVTMVGGVPRFVPNPPIVSRLTLGGPLDRSFRMVLCRYPDTLVEARREVLARYTLADVAFKVVGVGSVGTRCGIALYVSDGGDLLILQVKEASPSVLRHHARLAPVVHDGHRVVLGQRLMQAASDIFLGWADDEEGRHFYVRQLRDMKTSIPYEDLRGPVLANFATMCGWAVARAHAKSGHATRLSGYVGTSGKLAESLADFACSYADQCEQDFAAFTRAIRSGLLPAEVEPAG
jgi:uncharacterized protein (DUF2252 family)